MKTSPVKKTGALPRSHNLFLGLEHSHFDEKGSLNEKGIGKLVDLIRNRKSELYNSFGKEGTELFFDYYPKNKKNYSFVTYLARDIIIANTILFNEEL
ncbi:MAG: hypothetical protein PHU63_04300, partial [Candidatus ainarchaeum sp.]|nr:hypothetical protein [Candidatus ainarchaeum sp.]